MGRKPKAGAVQWDRQGEDCAFLLNGINRGDFIDWDTFKKSPAFENFKKKYVSLPNIKRNFEKTLARYNEFKKDGSGKLITMFVYIYSTHLTIFLR